MNLALWIAAGLFAVVGGISKAFVFKEKLAEAHGGEWTRASYFWPRKGEAKTLRACDPTG